MNREEATGKKEHPFFKMLEWLSQKLSHFIIVAGFLLMAVQFIFGNGWDIVEDIRASFETLDEVSNNQVELSEAVDNIGTLVSDTRQQITDIRNDVRELQVNQRTLMGEDRIFREIDGLTYVREPVYLGEPIRFFITAQRTQRGAECRFVQATPVFRDERNVDFFGPPVNYGQQFGEDATAIQPQFRQPEGLRPGRVTIRVIIDFECPSANGNLRRVQETTTTVPFLLIERE